ncbi:uncharacterized protein LOC131614391 [Vicia villosa]|uniref:uncharacterized protein LOC131614391 n=1 Tax=Vicia villosa TaxID=3911 RepID=UPI00273C5064|nr:uncharacterized protein LOC131614391 [Vicia villosa]
MADEQKGFSVKGCAKEISRHDHNPELQSIQLRRIKFVWKIRVPSKVGIFGWRFVLGRLPTREQLKIRGIIVDDIDCCCVFCFQEMETSSPHFDSCPFTRRIWNKVGQWIGDNVNLQNEDLRNFLDHFDKIKAVKERLTVGVIWIAVMWNLWMIRNAILFKGSIFNFDECFSAIVLSS